MYLLSEGKHAIQYQIDDDDYGRVLKYKWIVDMKRDKPYIVHEHSCKNKVVKIYLHRCVMGYTGKLEIDHINNDPTDNRKSNLRICTRMQNARNVKISKRNTSGVKGVSWDKTNKKWKARIRFDDKTIWLGRFETLDEAAKVYADASLKYHGEYSRLI